MELKLSNVWANFDEFQKRVPPGQKETWELSLDSDKNWNKLITNIVTYFANSDNGGFKLFDYSKDAKEKIIGLLETNMQVVIDQLMVELDGQIFEGITFGEEPIYDFAPFFKKDLSDVIKRLTEAGYTCFEPKNTNYKYSVEKAILVTTNAAYDMWGKAALNVESSKNVIKYEDPWMKSQESDYNENIYLVVVINDLNTEYYHVRDIVNLPGFFKDDYVYKPKNADELESAMSITDNNLVKAATLECNSPDDTDLQEFLSENDIVMENTGYPGGGGNMQFKFIGDIDKLKEMIESFWGLEPDEITEHIEDFDGVYGEKYVVENFKYNPDFLLAAEKLTQVFGQELESSNANWANRTWAIKNGANIGYYISDNDEDSFVFNRRDWLNGEEFNLKSLPYSQIDELLNFISGYDMSDFEILENLPNIQDEEEEFRHDYPRIKKTIEDKFGKQNDYPGSADWGGFPVWTVKGGDYEGTFIIIDIEDNNHDVILMTREFDETNEENIDTDLERATDWKELDLLLNNALDIKNAIATIEPEPEVIYEYICNDCKEDFESISPEKACANCSSFNIKQVNYHPDTVVPIIVEEKPVYEQPELTVLTDKQKPSIPSNVLEWCKSAAGHHTYESVKKVARWYHKLTGKNFTGGTSIGMSPQTLILDMKYQQSEVRIKDNYENGIEVCSEVVNTYEEFKAAVEAKYKLVKNN